MSAAATALPGPRALDLHRWGDVYRRRYGFPQVVHEVVTHLIRVTKSPAQCKAGETAWTTEDSVGQIATETGYGKRHVRRALRVLEHFEGIITVARAWQTSVVRIVPSALQRFADQAREGKIVSQVIREQVDRIMLGDKEAERRKAERARRLLELGGPASPATDGGAEKAPAEEQPPARSPAMTGDQVMPRELTAQIVRECLGERLSALHDVRVQNSVRMWRECGQPTPATWREQWETVAAALSGCQARRWKLLRREVPLRDSDHASDAVLMTPVGWGRCVAAARRHAIGECGCSQVALPAPPPDTDPASDDPVILEFALPPGCAGVQWEELLEQLDARIGRADREIWFGRAVAEVGDQRLSVLVPNLYYRDWIEEYYRGHIEELLAVAVLPAHA